MIIRSKAPLRLGFAGGGSDVSPFSELYGGAILNACISMYAYTTIIPKEDGKIHIKSLDKEIELCFDSQETLPINGELDLIKGVYNRIIKEFNIKPLSFEISTYVEAPAGSGLGTSSTLTVSILGAFVEWLKFPLGKYDIAHMAYQIERIDLAMAGGKQDQYAATFGGINFMEFYKDDKVIVNPLNIPKKYLDELAYNMVLFNTETSRLSSIIIEEQSENVRSNNIQAIDAIHQLKKQAVNMKEALLKGELNRMGEILNDGWLHKKQMAKGITNEMIDKIYQTAIENGALGGKVSGAGGGGFMMFFCPYNSRNKVVKALNAFGGDTKRFEFIEQGLTTWTI
jgi:D-glycero-alpha-D-manno-heptose-7-phosphate kinase